MPLSIFFNLSGFSELQWHVVSYLLLIHQLDDLTWLGLDLFCLNGCIDFLMEVHLSHGIRLYFPEFLRYGNRIPVILEGLTFNCDCIAILAV